MRRRQDVRVVLVTCGSLAEGRKIAKAVVEKRLAACVNLFSAPVESVYRWNGTVQNAREFLLVVKTTEPRIQALQKEIARLHSYDMPEFLVLRVDQGSREYLKWVQENVE
jgi:periplasmic divalent cation tolerance protein